MKISIRKVVLGVVFITTFGSGALAEIEEARNQMEAGDFEEARQMLWPAARSGNADAEELIGVMYAMGLGVDVDGDTDARISQSR